MSSAAATPGSGRFHALVRAVVVVIAIVTAALLLSSINHVDGAPVAGSVVATFDRVDDSAAAADELVLDGALTGAALGCALLGLCCLLAFAGSIRWRRSMRSAPSPLTPYRSLLAAATPRPTLVDPQRLSISRT